MLVVAPLIRVVRNVSDAHVVKAVELVYHRDVEGAVCWAKADKTSRERDLRVPLIIRAETQINSQGEAQA